MLNHVKRQSGLSDIASLLARPSFPACRRSQFMTDRGSLAPLPVFMCYLLSCLTRSAMNQSIERKELLKTVLPNGVFTSADVREIRLQPGQQSGRHLHPCAVLGYIVKGTATYQIEGEAEQILPAGSAFHEPAGAVIANFGNASDSEPMTFVAFYLLNGEQELIQMLD